MVKQKEIYISFDLQEYKQSKSYILQSEVDLLNSIKHLQNLREIIAEKNKEKILLHNLLASLIENLEKLDSKMPNLNIPKSIQKTSESTKILPEHEKKNIEIEKELIEIQRKLKELNS